jgi:hypothetical protein
MDIRNTTLNYELLVEVLQTTTINQLSQELYVNKNTIQRWLLLKSVPWQYHVDLKKILGQDIDYDNFSFIEKDQFFTEKKIVEYCLSVIEQQLTNFNHKFEDFILLEPSAGDGSFYNSFPHENKIGLDIDPKIKSIEQKDFLKWNPKNTDKPILCIGNPPFGLRGNLALRFINHAGNFSDFVCFILPPLFDSDGKGNCMNRVKNLNLIHSEKIDNNFYYPNGEKININVIFQIWSKKYKLEKKKEENCDDYVKIYSLTDGGTPSTTRNKKMLDKCDFYLASSSFEKEKMTLHDTFENLPNRRGYGIKIIKDHNRVSKIINSIDWPSFSFLATNSSFNLRTSIIKSALIEHGLKK